MSEQIAKIREVDLQMADLYKDFLPKRLFDTHVHLYGPEMIPSFLGNGGFFRDAIIPEDYSKDLGVLLPGVEQIRLNLMPMPERAFNDPDIYLRDKANEYIVDQLRANPQHVGSAYVMYHDSEQKIADMVSKPGIKAIKCYYFTPKDEINAQVGISDFLSEAAWVVANERKMPIILHLMRASGFSDPENFSYIMEMSARYPDAQLVLAHCARGFVSWTVVDQIRRIANRDNIWFDLAAICEVPPMMSSIMQCAGKRVMWGTDWPICLHRGRAVSIGTSQQWFTEKPIERTPYALLATESLLAFHQTASLMNLDQTQVEDIFYNNAVSLFGCD